MSTTSTAPSKWISPARWAHRAAKPLRRPPSQTALITGASCGIGFELARIFASHGYNLVLVSRDRLRLQSMAKELSAKHGVAVEVLAKDLSCPSAPEELFCELRKRSVDVDVLVNNAGFGMKSLFAECDSETVLQLLQVNTIALTHLTRLFLPSMLARGSGKIMNVASLAALVPGPLTAVYNASKAYVLSFSEALVNELQGTGVTVTALCPGPTRTKFEDRAGVANTPAFRGKIMDATTVAEAAFGGLMKGKPVVVPGFKNKLRILPIPWVPRRILAHFSRRYHEA